MSKMTKMGLKKLTGLCIATLLVSPVVLAAPVKGFSPSVLLDAQDATSVLPKRAMANTASEGRFNAEVLSGSRITLNLADGRALKVKRTRETRRANGERTWLGEFDGQPGSLLVLTHYRGMVNGFAMYNDETWEVEALGQGRARMYRLDESKMQPEGPIRQLAAEKAGSTTVTSTTTTAVMPATAAAPVTQDLLVTYTAAAAAANGGVDSLYAKVLSAVDAANAAYANSQIGITLNLVGFRQVTYTETGDMNTTIAALQTNGDGKMDEVHSWRNELGADIVSLLSNDSNYCGLGYLTTPTGTEYAAFNVVLPSCLAGHTLAHEIGHNQGNHHDRVSAGASAPAYPYSYGYRTCDYAALANGQNFRTVMGYACNGVPRVNQFSNPNLFYNNAAQMGVSYEADPANAADNARSMNNTAAVIAAYRNAPVPLPIAPSNLTGSATAFDRAALTWTDNSNNESGFVLQRADASGVFSDRATLSANVTSFTDTGLTGSTSYTYRIRAYNSTGISSYSNTFAVTTPATPALPVAPSPASASVLSTSVTVAWANVANETGYEILREVYNSRKGTWVASVLTSGVDTTSMTMSLSVGTYRFKVRAYNGAGYSSYVVVSCSGITGCASDGSFPVTRKY